MKVVKFILFAGLLCFQSAQASQLTRDELLSGSKIPERREFKESDKVGACEDFHKFVCAEEETAFQLPADRSIWFFSFSDNQERILQAKKNFFKKMSEGFKPQGARIQQVKEFYLACMNEKAGMVAEKKYLSEKLKKIQSFKAHKNFQKLAADGLLKPEFGGLGFETIPNLHRPESHDVLILATAMTFPEKSFYDNPQAVADLKDLAKHFFKALNFSDAEERADILANFETQSAKDFPSASEFRQLITADTYLTREAFLKKYPALGLNGFFKNIPKQVQIRDIAPKTLAWFDQQLSSGDLKALESFYLFHTLSSVMDDSYPEFRKQMTVFENKYLRGPSERPSRDERCTNQANSAFPFEIDEYLTPILFPQFPSEKVETLVAKVRQSIINKIEKNAWLSDAARTEAKNKMQVAKLFLVQPKKDSEWDFNPVQKYSDKDPILNVLNLGKAQIAKKLSDLKKPRDRDRWGKAPLELNAYYSPFDNQFVLLQGILQAPFFDPTYSEIENLGAIGSVIGHELGHGIDDNGARFDSKGAVHQWMTEKDLAEFAKRGQQFISRFDKVGHNGKLTLGENIGDHVGITSSYAAAFADKPEANVQDKQKFFKAYARLWCNVARPELEQNLLKTDPHSLGRERINQQVIHVDGFYEAFSCKPKDKMYVSPEDRIRVW